MTPRISALTNLVRDFAIGIGRSLARAVAAAAGSLHRLRPQLLIVAVSLGAGYALWTHPPIQALDHGEVAVRTNRLTGTATQLGEGGFLAIPSLHEVRRFPTRDQIYRPEASASATGESPFQSVEGLSIGVDLTVRYAIDPNNIGAIARRLPEDISGEIVEPIVQGVIYKLFARYTVREIFSSKRAEIQQVMESELKPKLAADGIILRSIQIGKVDLPQDYRAGMDRLLSEELETEKMRYTLELKDKRVKQTELEGEAEKVRREKSAEAAAREQIIAAKGQEEAMKHILPFKQKQIEQRQLEAEAEKAARIRSAEGAAQARRIEAEGESASRQKLADAEVYRLERIGKVNADQMEREGALITAHPLLIQKTLADKLSDKIQVIIAPPPTDGSFIGSPLLGGK